MTTSPFDKIAPDPAEGPAGADQPDPAPPRPHWIPAGVDVDEWSPELRAIVAGVINPAYDQLVLRAMPGLAQSTGITVVHLLWLEILDHLEFSRRALPGGPTEDAETRTAELSRHLRLVHSKLKASELLHRLDAFELAPFKK